MMSLISQYKFETITAAPTAKTFLYENNDQNWA